MACLEAGFLITGVFGSYRLNAIEIKISLAVSPSSPIISTVDREFYTKPNGHRISLFYTLIIITAVGFLVVPGETFKQQYGWTIILALPIVATAIVLLTRLFSRNGIPRCRTSIDPQSGAKGFHVGNISINLDEVNKIIKVNRPGIFGSELQIYDGKILPSTIIVLGELRVPDLLIETLREMTPRAEYKETLSSIHFLDWGLGISLAALIIIIISKVL